MPALLPPPEAERQGGLFTLAQARASGISSKRIRGQLSSGRWREVFPGVVLQSTVSPCKSHAFRAALLATGGVLSHSTAAALWGLPVPDRLSGEMHVTLPTTSHPRVAGIRLHRRPLGTGDRSWTSGVDVTSRSRTLVDCVATWAAADAADLVDHALRTRVVVVQQLRAMADSARSMHGAGQVRDVIEQACSGSWSAAERLLHDLLRRECVTGWTANARLELPGSSAARVDVWFPSDRVAVEVDGQAWHSSAERFQRDRERQNLLVLAGCTVLRFTWRDLTTAPDRVISVIRSSLTRPTGR